MEEKQKLVAGSVEPSVSTSVLWGVVDTIGHLRDGIDVRRASSIVGEGVERTTLPASFAIADAAKRHPWKKNKN